MSERKASLAHRLYTGDLSYDFVGKRKQWYIVSAVIVASSSVIASPIR